MLSTFPELFTYGLIAPFVLRVALGIFFVLQGIRRRKQDIISWNNLWNGVKIGSLQVGPILAKIQIVLGIFLFVGLYTQISAILAVIFMAVEWFKRHKVSSLSFAEIWMSVFIITIAASLLFLGAGLLAFDLPL
jgi:uncharacterized membrane protein YphA (DoxX/SURF4 family)